MTKILITGGAGFVGSQLGLHLKRVGDEVVLLDNMSAGYEDNILEAGTRFAKLVVKDIRDADLGEEMEDVDTVFHFAGTSSLPMCQANPPVAYDNNVTGLVNVLEWARRTGVRRVIFSSTSAVYENNTSIPFRESDQVAPDLVYASTKWAGEQICKAFAATYSMDIIIARFFNVYGEHQDIHRTMPPFVSYLAKEVFYDRRPVLFNKSDASRDYIYVGDVIDCLVCMARSDMSFRGDIFNLCSGKAYSVKEILALYMQVSGKQIDPVYNDPATYWNKFPILFESKPLDRERIAKEVYKNSIGDPKKTKLAFGFEAKMAFVDGLTRIHAYSLHQLTR